MMRAQIDRGRELPSASSVREYLDSLESKHVLLGDQKRWA